MPLWGCWDLDGLSYEIQWFNAPTGRKVIAQGNALGSVRQKKFSKIGIFVPRSKGNWQCTVLRKN